MSTEKDAVEHECLVATLEFMRATADHYGAEKGMDVYGRVLDAMPELKSKIFMGLLTGEFDRSCVTLSWIANSLNRDKIACIKAVRYATGMGLKEAKDTVDNCQFKVQRIELIHSEKRRDVVKQILATGYGAH